MGEGGFGWMRRRVGGGEEEGRSDVMVRQVEEGELTRSSGRGGGGSWWAHAWAGRRGGRRGVGFGCVEVPSRGLSNFEEQDTSWGEGEREYGKEERGGEGEGCWEGGRGEVEVAAGCLSEVLAPDHLSL
jgi:hypothetical protein